MMYFKDKYGEWILYDPELNKNTYILMVITNIDIFNWGCNNL